MKEALALDAKNDNTLWVEVITKESQNIKVTYEILPDGKKAPKGH